MADPATIMMGLNFGLSALSFGSGRREQRRMRRAMEAQTQLGRDNLNFAKDQWQRYLDTYGDLERRVVSDAQMGIDPERTGMLGRITSDTAQQYDMIQDRSRRELGRFGVDPTAGRFAGQDRSIDLGRASAIARGRDDIRQWAEDASQRQRLGVYQSGLQVGVNAGGNVQAAGQNLAQMYGNQAALHGNLFQQHMANAGYALGQGVQGAMDWWGNRQQGAQAPAQASATGNYNYLTAPADQVMGMAPRPQAPQLGWSPANHTASPAAWGNAGPAQPWNDPYNPWQPSYTGRVGG